MKVVLVWAFLAGGALIWSWGLWRYPTEWKDTVAYILTALITTRVLKVWLALEACRRLGADRNSGALELLLATPLRVTEILRGQLLALSKQFAGPAAVVLLSEFLFLMSERKEAGFSDLV